jgi:hypothetical protein
MQVGRLSIAASTSLRLSLKRGMAKQAIELASKTSPNLLLVFRVRVPRDDGHRFHGMMGTDSTRSWAVIPRDRGQV